MRGVFHYIFEMNTASLWKKEHSLLEEEASNISSLKKQILKESEMDASVQLTLNQQIDALKRKGALLAKKLEQEKHKHLELETVIGYTREKMERDRVTEATVRDGPNSESLLSLENRYKKLEYDLGQVNSKVNKLTESVEDKRSKINQNRMERVIDSGIFRNIEKELNSSELTFKKLLIDEIKHKKEYDKLLENYQDLKSRAHNLYSHQKTKTSKRIEEGTEWETGRDSEEPEPPLHLNKFTELEPSAKFANSRVKSLTPNLIDYQLEAEEQRRIIAVKKVMIETGVERPEDFPRELEEVDRANDILFNEMNNHVDQINEIEKYLASIRATKARNQMKFYGEKRELTKAELKKRDAKRLGCRIDQAQAESDTTVGEIRQFFDSELFGGLLESVGLVAPEGQVKDFDELKVLLQCVERKTQVYLREGRRVVVARGEESDRLEEMISKVRRQEESEKVMGKADFQEEYRRIVKNATAKSLNAAGAYSKKKSVVNLRKA